MESDDGDREREAVESDGGLTAEKKTQFESVEDQLQRRRRETEGREKERLYFRGDSNCCERMR